MSEHSNICTACNRPLEEKATTLDQVGQIVIPFFSGLAIYLLAIKFPIGHAVGLIAQPFWYHTSIKKKQWGIVVLTTWFVFSYILGIYNAWPNLW